MPGSDPSRVYVQYARSLTACQRDAVMAGSAGRAGCYNLCVVTDFSERLAALSTSPGVYLMRNAAGDVLYVGKAAALRNRVRSYFQARGHSDPKTRELVSHITDFEVVRTDTVREALILENELIKRHQ